MRKVAITPDVAHGLGYALNEATLLGIEPYEDEREVRLGFSVLALPETESGPRSATVTLVLSPVGRIAVSYRLGKWNDEGAPVQPLPLTELADLVHGFRQQPIYGWEFVDSPEERWAHWKDRLSVDVDWEREGRTHVLDVFQEDLSWGKERILDVRVWFHDLEVLDAQGYPINVTEFVERGRQWWAALATGDPRTHGHGIYGLSPDSPGGTG